MPRVCCFRFKLILHMRIDALIQTQIHTVSIFLSNTHTHLQIILPSCRLVFSMKMMVLQFETMNRVQMSILKPDEIYCFVKQRFPLNYYI